MPDDELLRVVQVTFAKNELMALISAASIGSNVLIGRKPNAHGFLVSCHALQRLGNEGFNAMTERLLTLATVGWPESKGHVIDNRTVSHPADVKPPIGDKE